MNNYGDYIPFIFNAPFKHSCIGVVVTQSYGAGEDSAVNLAVTQYYNGGFTLFARAIERSQPVSWIAFGY